MVIRLAVAMHKGGVGKSTLAVNLAHGLADAGMRVLLVDADPQGGASRYLGVHAGEDAPHLADVLRGRGTLAEAAVPVSCSPGLSVVPSDLELAGLERELQGHNAVRQAVDGLHGFDLVMFDTPPGWGHLTLSVLAAVRDVLAPAELKPLAMLALVDLTGMVAEVRREINPRLRLAGVVPFRVQRTRLSRECLADLETAFVGKVLPGIREAARVAESPEFRKPVQLYAPDSIGALDFQALTGAVLKMLK